MYEGVWVLKKGRQDVLELLVYHKRRTQVDARKQYVCRQGRAGVIRDGVSLFLSGNMLSSAPYSKFLERLIESIITYSAKEKDFLIDTNGCTKSNQL